MKNIINTLIVIACLLISNSAEAQFFKKLKKGIKDKVENATSKKEEKKNEKEANNEKAQSESPFDLDGLMDGMMKPVTFEDQYQFNFTATIEITDFGKKEDKSQIIQAYGEGAFWVEIEDQKGAMIYDINNKAMILLNEKDKKAQTLSLDMMKLAALKKKDKKQDKSEIRKVDFKRTGKTKEILGYESEEYLVTNEDGKMEMWFAEDVPFKVEDFFMGMGKMFSEMSGDNKFAEKGYVMEWIMFDKNGKKSSKMEVINLDEQSRRVNMSDYEIEKMY